MTDTQRDMAAQMADQLGRELPSGRFEPETVDGSDSDDSMDPFEQRLQDKFADPLGQSSDGSRPNVVVPSAPESTYELFDPTSTRTGLDTFGDLTRPGSILGSSNDAGDSPFNVPSMHQGKTDAGGLGYKATFDDDKGLQSPKSDGSFAQEYPRLSKIWTQFFGTENAAGAKTAKGEALDAAMKDLNEAEAPAPAPTAPKKEEPKNETVLEKAVREAAEEAAAAAAAAEAATGEKGADDKDATIPPDDYVDPEQVVAFNAYLREQSGYKGPVRDGDVDWDDQPKDSTGGRIIDQSDLYGDRTDQAPGQAAIPDGGLPLGNDHDINWGPDAGNPSGGLKQDVPGYVGPETDLSHLNPDNDADSATDSGTRTADRTIRTSSERVATTEGTRESAVQESNRSTTESSRSSSESDAVVRPMSVISDADDSNAAINFTDDSAASEDEGDTITGIEISADDASIVYTPGDGQRTDPVTFEVGEDENDEPDGAEDDSAPSSGRVFTPIEGRVTASDLRNLQTGRTLFNETPTESGTDTPAAEEGAERLSLPFEEIKWDLRVPSPLDEVIPMLTLEPIGGDDDSDLPMPDDE